MKLKRLRPLARTLFVGGAMVSSAGLALADDASMDGLKKENQELKSRMEVLEALAQKQGLLPSGKAPKLVTALSDMTISGFVQASYFYNTRNPADGKSDAYLWNTSDNSFSINKVKLTIASAAVATDKWDAGYRASLIFGEDAPNLNTGGEAQSFEALREAYVELNVPIGTGLNVKAGQLISLLNWESGDGGAANPNFSQGNQWWFTGNGPAAGVRLGYTFTDMFSMNVQVQNGLFQGPVDANEGKSVIVGLNFKPCEKVWFNVLGFYSPESDATHVAGASVIGGVKINDKLGTGFEFDYFNFDPTGPGSSSDLWSVGGWVWYDFTPTVGLAFRGDYIGSPDFVLGPAVRPGAGILTPDTDGDLASLTLTLNWKPVPNIKVQPEIRYDHTSFSNGLDGKNGRVTVGAGVSYLF